MLSNEEIIKLVLSVFLASLIGLEREFRKKPAGLRTHCIIALSSTIYTLVSIKYFSFDSARIVANILTGMGFIGAGAIISSNSGRRVGVTTASTLWIVAAIGIVVGVGYYDLAIFSTFITLTVLVVFRDIMKITFPRSRSKSKSF
ncbi:MAG: MgtC/SapB family protein [Candidatus Aenigmarchaeota archaeon]|nr:MgtC/SapB family protein [Candidatus Aenigmarchaeota archaeon]MDW8149303.1 MgtC/SapB family protein [Candidatus Aenigmarchaeota archaeon]